MFASGNSLTSSRGDLNEKRLNMQQMKENIFMTINTTSGYIMGFEQENMYCFRGVPYATAKRFQNAQPTCWDGVLDCTHWRDMPPQKEGGLQNSFENAPAISEDCLNLNIATTSLEKGAGLPIVIQFYGGAFSNGNNAYPQRCEPSIWLKENDMVFVSVNYRVNIFGFLYLSHLFGEGYDGNYGFSDQIAAIKWVYDNAETFGGDKNRITVYGYSAGGKSVGALIASPAAKDYFHRAIISSGGFQAIRTRETAVHIADRYLEILGHNDLEYLMNADMKTLLAAHAELDRSYAPTCLFGPVADDKLIPSNWLDHLLSPNGWNGESLIISSRRELGRSTGIDACKNAPKMIYGLFGDNSRYAAKAFATLANGIDDEKELGEIWVRILSDFMYRTHSDRAAAWLSSKGLSVWLCGMELQPALHVMADALIWGVRHPDVDKEAADRIAKTVKNMYISFICDGKPEVAEQPDWLPFNISGKKLLIGKEISLRSLDKPDTLTDFPNEAITLSQTL